MMDWTDRHCRFFLRGFSPRVLLYTEMITTQAILRGKRERLLAFDVEEHPVALQLGGSDPSDLAEAAAAGEAAGYDEVNLNCGCPSDRVSAGAFGACLMNEPALVAECVAAMVRAVAIPVTVKMRIGTVTGQRSEARQASAEFSDADYSRLGSFVRGIAAAGAHVAIVHARKAVLGGLSPKDNREIPALRFDVVARLKRDFAACPIVLNGGLRTVADSVNALKWCDGVMLGREAYHRPHVLAELDRAVHGASVAPAVSRREMAERMTRYAAREMRNGERLSAIVRHMLGLYSHTPGAREFRRTLSEGARAADARPELIEQAADRAERAAGELALAS